MLKSKRCYASYPQQLRAALCSLYRRLQPLELPRCALRDTASGKLAFSYFLRAKIVDTPNRTAWAMRDVSQLSCRRRASRRLICRAKIARTKGANDQARAILFGKLSAAISAAARAGGADPASNLRLASAIEKAKAQNCPKDIIERALSNAAAAGVGLEEVTFEGLGPSNVAVIIETLTNSKGRTTMGLRAIFKRHGAEIGSNGSVAFMFESQGRVVVPLSSADSAAQDALMEAAVDAEAQDVVFMEGEEAAAVLQEHGAAAAPIPGSHGHGHSGHGKGGHSHAPAAGAGAGGPPGSHGPFTVAAYVWADAGRVHSVRKALDTAGYKCAATEVLRKPSSTIEVPEGSEEEEKVGAFIAALEDHEDVQNVYHNAA